jgi:hypothetical protein
VMRTYVVITQDYSMQGTNISDLNRPSGSTF